MNYYVEFLGELKDDQRIQKRFVKHYNKWCDTINQYQEELNQKFDEQWKGEPIQDYSKCEEYEIGNELQLMGIKKHGERKGQSISFVLRKG